MKPATSKLIDAFLFNVRSQRIVCVDEMKLPGMDTTGSEVLIRIEKALRDILAGVDPAKALEIKRAAGQPQNQITKPLALAIYKLRKDGIEWGAIHRIMEINFEEAGLEPLTKERLKAIHKSNLEWSKQRDQEEESAHRILAFIEHQRNKQA
jgi:hypothetical protein